MSVESHFFLDKALGCHLNLFCKQRLGSSLVAILALRFRVTFPAVAVGG